MRTIRFLAIPVLFGLSLALGACSGSDDNTTEGVEVPDLVSTSFGDAQVRLSDLGLRWHLKDSDTVFAKPRPPGVHNSSDDFVVHDQDPDAGERVAPRSVIELEINCVPVGEELEEGQACQ